MQKQVDLGKAATFSIVINVVQIVAIIAIALLVLLTDLAHTSLVFMEFFICLAAVLVIWGAVIDIGQARDALRVRQQSDMLAEAYGQLEALNITLRAQRHDFMNHLQVVHSLIEMDEHDEAASYIERVYGDIQSVSEVLRTGNPAVNALLKVKAGEGKNLGIAVEMHVHSKWDRLSIPAWEMCRVLGNLIDNAMDALSGTPEPRLIISLGEELHAFTFQVENNGPEIPVNIRRNIFQPGITTKGAGRGMGLAIVQRILTEHGGSLELDSTEERTVFRGRVPHEAVRVQPAAATATATACQRG